MRKLKFYFLGFVPGLLIVFFILNKKGARCSGYLPNNRVIAESLSKEFNYSSTFSQEMKLLSINEKFLRDHIFAKGRIDFNRSNAQKKKYPFYILTSPKKKPEYEVHFEKCDQTLFLKYLKKL
ncbi:MAG: hypothetical protein FDW93_04790 [Bergeyella sp.]|nr:hypothetical protein [Bergeyella sp.]